MNGPKKFYYLEYHEVKFMLNTQEQLLTPKRKDKETVT